MVLTFPFASFSLCLACLNRFFIATNTISTCDRACNSIYIRCEMTSFVNVVVVEQSKMIVGLLQLFIDCIYGMRQLVMT